MAAKIKKQVTSQTTTKIEPTAEIIISTYMDYVLENGERPKSVYKFAKENGMEEADFYNFFGSFEGLREHIWVAFYENTILVLNKDKGYVNYPNKEKMLSFFFTFFELLTANRSYVLFTLRERNDKMKNLKQLSKLRLEFKDFAADLIERGNEEKNSKLVKNPVRIFSEGAWVQMLFLLKYWMDDNSAGFEKTDIAIEKSVKAIFDVFETTPLESVLDLGKFLFKDRFVKA
ncbi:TetR family transcriptional regulator C-terminal domain-containing protein [Flavimarina sp. Hel_I_48]|uniref:TetR family transcriptional regulator C-terminal domain-containing protein n=1 Tax=Flavimarina sp. Hel_I_48 TaxID=1392488 RepID=UPI0004DED104|nr:TetR family transcriptional regulator C-terminal domain-containing protein [Flavimarina sp. Hel_I_48]